MGHDYCHRHQRMCSRSCPDCNPHTHTDPDPPPMTPSEGKGDPERIWLQNAEDAKAIGEGRLWCEDKVWPECAEQQEPTEYVRADLFSRLERELAEAREARAILEGHLTAAIDDYNDARRQDFEEAAHIAENTIEPNSAAAALAANMRAERIAAAIRQRAEGAPPTTLRPPSATRAGGQAMKMTKLQTKALKQLSTGRVNGKYMPLTLVQLVALGYAQKEMSVTGWHWMFSITDAGRAAMKETEGRS